MTCGWWRRCRAGSWSCATAKWWRRAPPPSCSPVPRATTRARCLPPRSTWRRRPWASSRSRTGAVPREPAPLSLADGAVEVAIEGSELLAKGFRDYRRYRFRPAGEEPTLAPHVRDVLRAGRVAAVLPIDLARDEVVLLRQFRMAAHLANGRGELVEIVAGRVEGDEQPLETARRESIEEIGVAPSPLIELFSVLPTPGITDEEVTLCLGIVDAARVPARAGAAAEGEQTRPVRVSIDTALAALAAGTMHNGILVMALQWLALHRGRLAELARGDSG